MLEFLYLFVFLSLLLYVIIGMGMVLDRDCKYLNKKTVPLNKKSVFIKYWIFDLEEYLKTGIKKPCENNRKHISQSTIIVDIIGYTLYLVSIVFLFIRVYVSSEFIYFFSGLFFVMFNLYWITIMFVLLVIEFKLKFPFNNNRHK